MDFEQSVGKGRAMNFNIGLMGEARKRRGLKPP